MGNNNYHSAGKHDRGHYTIYPLYYYKTGVPENPLPDAPETWNICYKYNQFVYNRFGQHEAALQNFRPLTQY